MSSSNRVTLTQLDKMTAEEVQAIPQDQLVMLTEDLADKAETQKARDAKLKAEIARRYATKAADLRASSKKMTGTVNIIDGDYQIKANLPKKVEWDQPKLREAIEVIKSWKENPDDYVTTELSVPEKNYEAWPPVIRKVFEGARTLKTQTQTFKFEKREAA